MLQNLELKAPIQSINSAKEKARYIDARYKGTFHQKDIYYDVPRGRLKLRIINDRTSELIFYRRVNKKGSRYSQYLVVPVSNYKLMDLLCAYAFNRMVIVEKKRRVYLYNNARIHIDTVKGLGDFIEFEVIVKHGKGQARKLLNFLSQHFNICKASSIAVSYSDLKLQGQ